MIETAGGRQSNQQYLHQQAGFTAGTVTNDDQLSADFSHGCRARRRDGRWEKKVRDGGNSVAADGRLMGSLQEELLLK